MNYTNSKVRMTSIVSPNFQGGTAGIVSIALSFKKSEKSLTS